MKLVIFSIIIIINSSIMSANPLQNKVGEDFLGKLHLLAKKDDLRNIHSMKAILMKYVNAKFPHLDKHRQTKILKTLVHKINKKIIIEIRKENLRNSWMAKGDMLARMLK